jgi:hypothetical protein
MYLPFSASNSGIKNEALSSHLYSDVVERLSRYFFYGNRSPFMPAE